VVRISMPRLRREVSAAPRARRRPARDVCGASAARRGSGCAEQRESRDPLPLAPCHAGRRRSTVLQLVHVPRVSSQTIGCQTAVRSSPTRHAQTSRIGRASCSADAWNENAPPGSWRRWGVSNRSDPVVKGDALRRVPSEPGPCTSVPCFERSVPEPARPAERHVRPRLLSDDLLAHSRPARAAGGVGRPLRTRPHRAEGRARASSQPVGAGVPWAFGVEMGERGHEIVSTSESVSGCSDDSRNEKSRRR
jgi:hypothetical protein